MAGPEGGGDDPRGALGPKGAEPATHDEPAPARYGTTMLRYHPGVALIVTDAIAAVDLQPGDGERAVADLRDADVLLHSARMR